MSARLSPQRETEIRNSGYVRPKARPGFEWTGRTADERDLARQAEALDAARVELLAELAAVRAERDAPCAAELQSVAADIASAVPSIEAGPRTEFERGLSVGARSLRLRADELEAGGDVMTILKPRDIAALDRPAREVAADVKALVARQRCQVLADAAKHSSSPSDRIAYALDVELLLHTVAPVSTDADLLLDAYLAYYGPAGLDRLRAAIDQTREEQP
jgi:hypothetical protein